MPWCEECSKYMTPSSMKEDGTCPSCGKPVEEPEIQSTITAKNVNVKDLAKGDDGKDGKAPWHFKLLLAILAVYLGWRFYQLVTGQL